MHTAESQSDCRDHQLFQNEYIITPKLVIFKHLFYLKIIPRARKGSESIAHEAEGLMGY